MSRAVMQQALEALKACLDYIAPHTLQGEEDADTAEEAIAVIKAALAQPEQEPLNYPECKGMNCGCTDGVSHSLECHAEHSAAIAGGRFVMIEDTAAKPAVQVVASPALRDAWLRAAQAEDKAMRLEDALRNTVHTSPPQRQPLTDAEVWQMLSAECGLLQSVCAKEIQTASPPNPLPQNVPQIPQEHSSNEVYRVISKDGSTCHFGNYATAKASARGGKVETVKLRDLRLVTEPCRTCVSLAQAVMSDQTSHDQFKPDWRTEAVLVEEMQRMAKEIETLTACLYQAQEAAKQLAQPAQEPVAWQWLDTATFRKKIPPTGESECWNPVYTSPPPRQPLTDDEMDLICENALFTRISLQQLGRNVEAAHGIGDKT